MEEKFARLKKFNIIAGFLHLAQGLIMIIISNDFMINVTRSFLDFNPSTRTLFPASVEIFSVKFGYLVALFLLLSALFHFLIAFGYYQKYIDFLKRGQNPYRWNEYSISASIMIVAIAMLTGIYDISLLIAVFFLNAFMVWFGMLMEKMNEDKEKLDWLPFIYGCVAGAIPWVVIGFYLFGAGGGEGGPPNFVYWIYLSLFIFFNCFAINMYLQYKKVGKWKDYLYGEWIYIILSLVAKSLLAWQVFAGALRPV